MWVFNLFNFLIFTCLSDRMEMETIMEREE